MGAVGQMIHGFVLPAGSGTPSMLEHALGGVNDQGI
jgi:hypothetical protein